MGFQLEMRRCQFNGDEFCEVDFQTKARKFATVHLDRPLGMQFSRDMKVRPQPPATTQRTTQPTTTHSPPTVIV